MSKDDKPDTDALLHEVVGRIVSQGDPTATPQANISPYEPIDQVDLESQDDDDFDPFAALDITPQRSEFIHDVLVYEDDAHTRKSYSIAFANSDRYAGVVIHDPAGYKERVFNDEIVIVDLAYSGEYCEGSERPDTGADVIRAAKGTPSAILIKSSKGGIIGELEQGIANAYTQTFLEFPLCAVYTSLKIGLNPGTELIEDLEKIVQGEMGRPINARTLDSLSIEY